MGWAHPILATVFVTNFFKDSTKDELLQEASRNISNINCPAFTRMAAA